MVDGIPMWLTAVGTLLLVATILGTAVAVYRTSVQSTSLREAERTIERLRGEIGDYQRREAENEGNVKVLQAEAESCKARVRVLEDVISRRADDEHIRTELAAIRLAMGDLAAEVQELRNNR